LINDYLYIYRESVEERRKTSDLLALSTHLHDSQSSVQWPVDLALSGSASAMAADFAAPAGGKPSSSPSLTWDNTQDRRNLLGNSNNDVVGSQNTSTTVANPLQQLNVLADNLSRQELTDNERQVAEQKLHEMLAHLKQRF